MPDKRHPLYAEVVPKAAKLRDQEKTHTEVFEALNDLGFRTRIGKPWQQTQQIVKLIRTFQ